MKNIKFANDIVYDNYDELHLTCISILIWVTTQWNPIWILRWWVISEYPSLRVFESTTSFTFSRKKLP